MSRKDWFITAGFGSGIVLIVVISKHTVASLLGVALGLSLTALERLARRGGR